MTITNAPEAPIYNKYGEIVRLSDAVCNLCSQRVGLNTNPLINDCNEVVCEHCWRPEASPREHTPGPWVTWKAKRDTQAEFCIAVGIEVSSSRVRIASLPDMSAIGEDDANARLIAASPEMLSALEDVESKIVAFQNDQINWRPDDFLFRVRAAIRRAKGE